MEIYILRTILRWLSVLCSNSFYFYFIHFLFLAYWFYFLYCFFFLYIFITNPSFCFPSLIHHRAFGGFSLRHVKPFDRGAKRQLTPSGSLCHSQIRLHSLHYPLRCVWDPIPYKAKENLKFLANICLWISSTSRLIRCLVSEKPQRKKLLAYYPTFINATVTSVALSSRQYCYCYFYLYNHNYHLLQLRITININLIIILIFIIITTINILMNINYLSYCPYKHNYCKNVFAILHVP